MKEKNNYYYILTADVDNDERLSDFEKLMFARITGLTYETGYCYASNRYFEEKYKVSRSKVDRAIRKLKEYGYIYTKITYKDNSKEIDKRLIFLADTINKELVKVYSKSTIGIITSDYTPIITSDYDNNIIDNIINLIIEKNNIKKDREDHKIVKQDSFSNKNQRKKKYISDYDIGDKSGPNFMDYNDKSKIATIDDLDTSETF